MSTKVSIQESNLKMTSEGTRQGSMVVDMFVSKVGPPDGDIPEPEPGSLWDLMSVVPLTEVRVRKPRMNMKSLAKVTSMLLTASGNKETESRAPTAWLVNSNPSEFLKWLGLRPSVTPSSFLGLPLFCVPFVEEDRLVLMCARSRKSDPLNSEQGYVLLMEK